MCCLFVSEKCQKKTEISEVPQNISQATISMKKKVEYIHRILKLKLY
jgi:hypothetical protein